MKQVYKATDKIDGEVAYFYFNDESNMHTVLSEDVCIDENDAIDYFKQNSNGNWNEYSNSPRRNDMLNPVLIAEW